MRASLLCLPLAVLSACASGSVRVSQHEIDEEAPAVARAATIAAAAVGPLRALEDALPSRWEACRRERSCTPQKFLTETEERLLEILDPPEMAAMRDWARQGFRRAAGTIDFYRSRGGSRGTGEIGMVLDHRWGRAADAERTPRARSRPRLAALKQDSREGLFVAVFSAVFAEIEQLVRRPRELAEANDLIAELCVESSPEGAEFFLFPSSEPQQRRSGVSVGTIVVYRGLYAYEIRLASSVERGGVWRREAESAFRCDPDAGSRSCSKIDLVNDARPVFSCDQLRDSSGLRWRCSRREGVADGCARRS